MVQALFTTEHQCCKLLDAVLNKCTFTNPFKESTRELVIRSIKVNIADMRARCPDEAAKCQKYQDGFEQALSWNLYPPQDHFCRWEHYQNQHCKDMKLVGYLQLIVSDLILFTSIQWKQYKTWMQTPSLADIGLDEFCKSSPALSASSGLKASAVAPPPPRRVLTECPPAMTRKNGSRPSRWK